MSQEWLPPSEMQALRFLSGQFTGTARIYNEFGDEYPPADHRFHGAWVAGGFHFQEVVYWKGRPALYIWTFDAIEGTFRRWHFFHQPDHVRDDSDSGYWATVAAWKGTQEGRSLVMVGQGMDLEVGEELSSGSRAVNSDTLGWRLDVRRKHVFEPREDGMFAFAEYTRARSRAEYFKHREVLFTRTPPGSPS